MPKEHCFILSQPMPWLVSHSLSLMCLGAHAAYNNA
jgi:hypothetical protein